MRRTGDARYIYIYILYKAPVGLCITITFVTYNIIIGYTDYVSQEWSIGWKKKL